MLHPNDGSRPDSRWCRTTAVLCLLICTTPGIGQDRTPPPTTAQIRQTVDDYFARKKGYKPGDLIAQSDTEAVIAALRKKGWVVPKTQVIVRNTLSDSDSLVQIFRSDKGRRFMRAVAGYRLIFDRLDRVMRESGGPAMVRQLVRLPDGPRYAAWETPRAVPDLVDFLPKTGSAKTRVVKDYRKPTGRIYTQADLLTAIEQAFSGKSAAQTTATH